MITFHSSTETPLSVDETYDELMTHLSFGGLGHRGHDHHKAPQRIEPAGTEGEERGERSVRDTGF